MFSFFFRHQNVFKLSGLELPILMYVVQAFKRSREINIRIYQTMYSNKSCTRVIIIHVYTYIHAFAYFNVLIFTSSS